MNKIIKFIYKWLNIEHHSLSDDAIKICSNPQTKPRVLSNYASFYNTRVIHALLDNPNTPPCALDTIASKKEYRFCLKIVTHKNTDKETLRFLTKHPNIDIRKKAKQKLYSHIAY